MTGDIIMCPDFLSSLPSSSHSCNNHVEERQERRGENPPSHRVSESNSSQGDATPTSEAENEGRGQEQVRDLTIFT